MPSEQRPEHAYASEIWSHIAVVSLADYYDIDGLVYKALGEVSRLLIKYAGGSWLTDLPILTNKAQDSTGSATLITMLARALAAHLGEFVNSKSLSAIQGTSDFALELVASCHEQVDRLKTDAARLAEENKTLTRENARQARLLKKVDTAVSALQLRDRCANINCLQPFACVIPPSSEFLKCRTCGFEHQGPGNGITTGPPTARRRKR